MSKHYLQQCLPALGMVAVQVAYAGNTLFGKAAFAAGVSPMAFVVYRQAISFLFLAPAATLDAWRGGGRSTLGRRGFALVFFTALVGVTLNQLLYFIGLKYASASLTSAVINIIPAITFVMAASVGLEKVDLRSLRTIAKIFGTILCVGGAIFMALFKGPKLTSPNPQISKLASLFQGESENWILGCSLLFGASCFWALWLILQVPICRDHLDPLPLATWLCFLSSLQSAVITLIFEPGLKVWKLNSSFEFLACLYTGVIGTGMSFYLQAWVVAKRGPLFSAMFNPLCTVVTTILAILMLHEHLYIGSLVGAVAVVVGLYIVLWGKAEDLEVGPKIPISINEASEIIINHETSNIKEPFLLNDVTETA